MENPIETFYDQACEREWVRLDGSFVEFGILRRTIRDFFPEPPARVLENGGGPGRLALYLQGCGYETSLIDLSEANIRFARKMSAELNLPLAYAEQGDATDLSRFTDESFDAVVMMGPLYHLLDAAERSRAISEAVRVLKRGGIILSAMMGRFTWIRFMLKHGPARILESREALETLLSTGNIYGTESSILPDTNTVLPSEVFEQFESAGVESLTVLAAQGFSSMMVDRLREMPPKVVEEWIEINYRLAAEPSLLGTSEHLFHVGKKLT